MDNPTEHGVYTTIFRDGSIILYNEWLTFENPKLNKWYFNESCHGGIIHWFKPEENYTKHTEYKIPDFVMRDLIKGLMISEACYLEMGIENYEKALDNYLEREYFKNLEEAIDKELQTYWKDYEL